MSTAGCPPVVCSSTPFLQSCMTSGQVPTYQRIEETAATGLWNSDCCFSLSPKFTFISNIPFAWFGRWDTPGTTLNWTELFKVKVTTTSFPVEDHSREGKGPVMLNLSVTETVLSCMLRFVNEVRLPSIFGSACCLISVIINSKL